MYVLVRVRLYGGEARPLPFLPPPHSISLSLGIVVPSTGNFSKFCYPLIFIRFKCFLGKGELPNRPAPFMDVCARIFFYPDFEGGWVHWKYRSSCATTVIVATATCRTNDWLSLLSRHILNAIYRRQCVTRRITMSDELVEKCCDWYQSDCLCDAPYFIYELIFIAFCCSCEIFRCVVFDSYDIECCV